MVNRHRAESPGAWHHILNRGSARRTVIEGRRDAEQFSACLERVVSEGLLEVHAYCLMGTHYHLLARSPVGELSRAMMLVQNTYSRWFNRGRRRDGPLWRGRFLSKLVRSDAYWQLLVRYIDFNPVKAGIVAAPHLYELGSAWHYSRSLEGPPWLSRREVEGAVMQRLGKKRYEPPDYIKVYGAEVSESAAWMIQRGAFGLGDAEGAFVNLVGSAPSSVREWMRRKAMLADGSPVVGVAVIAPSVMLEQIGIEESLDPNWQVQRRRRRCSAWRILRCALLHHYSGCTLEFIATQTQLGASTVGRFVRDHAVLLTEDSAYSGRCSELLVRLVGVEYGEGAG